MRLNRLLHRAAGAEGGRFAAFESNALNGRSLVVSYGWFMQ